MRRILFVLVLSVFVAGCIATRDDKKKLSIAVIPNGS